MPTRVMVLALAVLLMAAALPAYAAKDKNDGLPADAVLLFSADGMRPDLMEKYAKDGAMPSYKALMKVGATGKDGMLQAFPPNTGVGWFTLATGTYPSDHGATNDIFFQSGDTFSSGRAFTGAGVLQADTIANAAERAGAKVAQIDWVRGGAAGIAGPTVEAATFFSARGVLRFPSAASEQAGAAAVGLSYQVASFAPAAGWTNVPSGDPAAPPMQTLLSIASTEAAQNPNRTYDVYVYDSVVDGNPAYDRIVLAPTGAGKDGILAAANLKAGDFKDIKLRGADGLIGSRAGQSAGFYTKLITLDPNLSSFKLYFTRVGRANAACSTLACDALPAGGAGESRLEKYIADNLPTPIAADFVTVLTGIIDEDTAVQQGRDLGAAYGNALVNYILGTLQPDTELALVGYRFTDEVSHQFMGLVTPLDPDGSVNPCYDVVPKFDDTQCAGRGTAGRVVAREGYIRSGYSGADFRLKLVRDLMGGDPTTFAVSDHGFGAQRYAVNAQKVLFDARVHNTATNIDESLHASSANAVNCGAAATDLAKACWAGGTIQLYVNSTLPSGITYEAVRTAAINAFQNLTDPANPGKKVIMKILKKEELSNVDGSDSLHPTRSGDVVVVTEPPYQSDGATSGVAIALSHFFGNHGFLPDYVNATGNINMHATFVASGPPIKHKEVKGVRAIDVAPTVAFVLGFPGPEDARGRILDDILKGAH